MKEETPRSYGDSKKFLVREYNKAELEVYL